MPDKRKIEITVDCESCKVDIDQEQQALDSLSDCAEKAEKAEKAGEARQQLEERLKNSREAAYGLLRGLEAYASEATNAAKQVEKAFEKAFKNIEDQLVRLITKGKFSLKQFLRDLAADTARAVIRIGVTGPIADKLGTALRGTLGLPVPAGPADVVTELKELDETGKENLQAQKDTETRVTEVVGECAKQLTELQTQSALLERIVKCSCAPSAQLQQFQVGNESGGFGNILRDLLGPVLSGGAQQFRVDDALKAVLGKGLSGVAQGFHGGGVAQGRPGQERLTLLESGVTALAQGAGGVPQQVQVVVENRGATQQEVVEQRAEADGGRLVVNVALDDITRRGPLSQALEQTYALGRRTG